MEIHLKLDDKVCRIISEFLPETVSKMCPFVESKLSSRFNLVSTCLHHKKTLNYSSQFHDFVRHKDCRKADDNEEYIIKDVEL